MKELELSIIKELQALQIKYLHSSSVKTYFLKILFKWPVFILGLFCGSTIIAYSLLFVPYCKSSLFAGLLILFLVLINLLLSFWILIKRKQDVKNRIKSLIELLKDVNRSSFDELIDELKSSVEQLSMSTSILPSHDFTMIYLSQREDSPLPFPSALLCPDHIIGLCSGQTSPCQVVCLHDKCLTLQRGDLFHHEQLSDQHRDEENDLCKFCVTKSPFVDQVEMCLQGFVEGSDVDLKRPKSMMTKNGERLMRLLMHVFIPVLVVSSLAVVSAWYVLWPCFHTNDQMTSLFVKLDDLWVEIFVITPVLTILPILPITAPMIVLFLYVMNEAKTLSLCCTPTPSTWFHARSGVMSPGLHSNDEMLVDAEPEDRESSWLKMAFQMVRGKRNLFGVNGAAFDGLGSLTALCCINKEGILSWFDSAPEKVSFFKQVQSDDQHNKELVDPTPIGLSPVRMVKDGNLIKFEVLSLSQDVHNSRKLHFDDPDWSLHLSSLKPIVLTILTNNKPPIRDKSTLITDCPHLFAQHLLEDLKQPDKHSLLDEAQILSNHRQQLHFTASKLNCQPPEVTSLEPGLRSFIRLVGLDPNVSLLHNSKLLLTAYKKMPGSGGRKKSAGSSFNESPFQPTKPFLGYVHAVVLSQWPHNDQDYILTSGCPDLVIELCSHYWDGSDVKILDDGSRRKLIDSCHRNAITGSCVMFAFKPATSELSNRRSFFGKFGNESNESCRIPSNQIFVGSVSMQYQPRANVFQLVEALDGASIRFVHFTSEDEFKARVFAEKMGLEVGWNCHISLAPQPPSLREEVTCDENNDSDNQEDDVTMAMLGRSPQTPLSESSFSDSAFYQQNRAKLPRGIENILPHIEQVDNVPLLVPLFTDCDPQSTQQMLSVMQRYDEVVCCVGSSECIDNMRLFAQADISIAIRPMLSSRTRKESSNMFKFKESPRLDSSPCLSSAETFMSSNGGEAGDCRLMALARSFNTFPCCVTTQGDNSFILIYNMIAQARHCLFLSTVSILLLIHLLLMITTIQLLSSIMRLPLVFTPLDVLWLSLFISPLISFSILASPRDRDLMTWASLKNTSRRNTSWRVVKHGFKQFAAKFLPSCVLIVLIFALCILSTCDRIKHHVTENSNGGNETSRVSIDSVTCYPCFTILSNITSHNPNLFKFALNSKLISQQISASAYVLYAGVISSGYVHRWRSVRGQSPLSNRVWITSLLISWMLQAIYSSVVITSGTYRNVVIPDESSTFQNIQFGTCSQPTPFIYCDSPLFRCSPEQIVIWILFFIWIFPLLLINEGTKHREIKLWTRNQKRARLAFGTKLGMNSPF